MTLFSMKFYAELQYIKQMKTQLLWPKQEQAASAYLFCRQAVREALLRDPKVTV